MDRTGALVVGATVIMAPGREDASSLIQAYGETGDRRTIEKIVEMHRGLISHLAGRHARTSDETYEDLMQVAHLGLMKAVRNYDDAPGAAFATYAYAVMEGEIRHHLRDTPMLKKPRWARGLYSRVTAATSRLDLQRPDRLLRKGERGYDRLRRRLYTPGQGLSPYPKTGIAGRVWI